PAPFPARRTGETLVTTRHSGEAVVPARRAGKTLVTTRRAGEAVVTARRSDQPAASAAAHSGLLAPALADHPPRSGGGDRTEPVQQCRSLGITGENCSGDAQPQVRRHPLVQRQRLAAGGAPARERLGEDLGERVGTAGRDAPLVTVLPGRCHAGDAGGG